MWLLARRELELRAQKLLGFSALALDAAVRLGRRADQLEAVNRVGRTLASSLDREQALSRFLAEVATVFEFDRLAIVIAEGDDAFVMANAGREHETLFAAGTSRPVAGSVLQDILADGQTIVRGDMKDSPHYPEERELAAIGLQSRVVAPLTAEARLWGCSRSRASPWTRSQKTKSS